ncbi:putative membrane protein [Lachnospiraceae bacterium PF1-22]|uniref:ECF transporter S component n=1 Tax=Ohessyouella blattaphilus TaxID=2949333 RepID=UPI003E18C260
MRNQKTKQMVLTGLFVCMGLVIPYFTGHAFGIPGTVLLPMHIPVLICGLLLGEKYGFVCGIVTPVISSLLTGMPALWPVLPMMTGELAVYGTLTGLSRHKLRLPLYPSLLLAMFAGRIVSAVIFSLIMLPEGITVVIKNTLATATTGLPGIIIQLAIIPATVKLLERVVKADEITFAKEPKVVSQAVAKIKNGDCSLVLIKNEQIIHEASGPGVKPLLDLMAEPTGRELLEGAYAVDKIIGKAAAMIMIAGGVKNVYGLTMSRMGEEYLANRHMNYRNDRIVDVISNRTGSGICPIEKSVLSVDDPQEGYRIILTARNNLMSRIS